MAGSDTSTDDERESDMTITENAPSGSSAQAAAAGGGMASDRKLHIFFVLLSATTLMLFAKWGLGYIGVDSSIPIFLIATVFGTFMAFNIGGNDVANSFGTSVGAGTLSIKQALLVAAVFEVSGAIIAGGEVTDTVRKGIVDLGRVQIVPQDFMFIMMAALLAAALWLMFASWRGYPVSTTHSIIGGIVGASVTLGYVANSIDDPMSMVQWGQVGQIAVSPYRLARRVKRRAA